MAEHLLQLVLRQQEIIWFINGIKMQLRVLQGGLLLVQTQIVIPLLLMNQEHYIITV